LSIYHSIADGGGVSKMEDVRPWKAEIKPTKAINDLAALAGKWNASVDIKISNPYHISMGPISVKTSSPIFRGKEIQITD
jgi:hypothetical protein